ncbi:MULTISPECIES: MATE family Na+-driven efflux transporter [unclassified Oceanispirochaeta]|uniref:MATE family Na+-driven efflux transporter n=1 Tax=unclassified Oceanispirochaeta TaxID=2635722 RepID=UPI000E08E70A|nr:MULTISPECIES: MATE family Na+-driven efflux transporter [unclassified Oceanispirochaeta]MBF9018490.1 multidrug transporter [Oceanispirochaeta sp. M2]NPD74897.1 multidrug transporter [Oceanispirochaeta sp. M1]RDG29283.1 multidrug transporter [Oceanispirochaeta sp. M1]
MFQETGISLKKINYKMLMALLLSGLFPAIYMAVRVRFLGNIPSDWGVNIASQLSWVNLLYEIVNEAILLPVFFLFGKVLKNKEDTENRLRTGLIITFGLYCVLSILISLMAKPLVIFMAQQADLVSATVTYIRWESLAVVFSILFRFLLPVFILINKERYIYIFLATQMFLSLFFDTLLISSLPFSLNIGVNGIAFSNLLTNVILVGICLFFLSQSGYRVLGNKRTLSFSWTREWLRIGGYSGVESLVRNLAFMIVILRMINVVNEQGTFWVTNNFIWGWLLLPVLALGELIKRDCAEDSDNINRNFRGYMSLTTIIVLLWIVTIPLWKSFLVNVMGVQNPVDIFNIALISLIFYIVFAYNNVIDSIFYGIGRTDLMLIQSLATNLIFYVGAYAMYLKGIFIPSLTGIAILFGLGIVFDSLITFLLFYKLMKKDIVLA